MEKEDATELRVASFSCYLETAKHKLPDLETTGSLNAKQGFSFNEDGNGVKEAPIILANIIPSLQNSHVQKPVAGRRRRRRGGILNGFGCHSPCFDKKAVHIDEIVARTFPLQQEEPKDEKKNPPQPQPQPQTREDENENENETSCDDFGSESSSDLFEIGNLSRSFSVYQHHHFCCEDNISDCASSYAPSQASVQWSVVTTSTEDLEEKKTKNEPRRRSCPEEKKGKKKKTVAAKGLLIGCKSRKSIEVADNVCIKIRGSR